MTFSMTGFILHNDHEIEAKRGGRGEHENPAKAKHDALRVEKTKRKSERKGEAIQSIFMLQIIGFDWCRCNSRGAESASPRNL